MATKGSNMRLPRSAPEAQGISSSAISAFLADLKENVFYPNSIMIMRHGNVVAEGWWEPYGPDIPHQLYSLSKSFTSSAVGMAVHEGLLTIDDRVIDHFPDETPDAVSDNLAAMRVRHLLSMNTGHDEDTTSHLRENGETNWAKAFLSLPVEHEPGTHFLYNSGATYMLSAIVQKLTSQTLLEYLEPRLFVPLGIQNPTWQTCPRGINVGGWGLSVTTEDIACFGQMLLQKGEYNGQQILTPEWVELATSYHSDNSINQENTDWRQGYGFQFWLCRHNAYRGDGAFGQYCVVMPEQDAVFAATSGVSDMQAVLDILWDDLLPAMQDGPQAEAPEDVAVLKARLEQLEIPARIGALVSPLEAKVSGNKYALEENQLGLTSIAFAFDEDNCVVTLADSVGEKTIACGRGKWVRGTMDLGILRHGMIDSKKVAATSSWLDDDTLTFNLCLYETPHALSMTCEFINDEIVLAPSMNVSFDEEGIPPITGRLVQPE